MSKRVDIIGRKEYQENSRPNVAKRAGQRENERRYKKEERKREETLGNLTRTRIPYTRRQKKAPHPKNLNKALDVYRPGPMSDNKREDRQQESPNLSKASSYSVTPTLSHPEQRGLGNF